MLRLLHKDQSLLDTAKLGFEPHALARFRRSFEKAWGMVLVTGPTGSGKTTTLYATVNALNSPDRNIITVEDPIEYRIAGIKQSQVNKRAGYTFATGLRAALRTDPDVILIGEVRDLETARICAESALTGHLVLSTLHANDAASSTTRLIEMGLEPYLVTSALECVVAQRLLRRLCPSCAVAEPATPNERLELSTMSLLGSPDQELVVRRPVGLCPVQPPWLSRAVRGAGGPGHGRRAEVTRPRAGAGPGHRHGRGRRRHADPPAGRVRQGPTR